MDINISDATVPATGCDDSFHDLIVWAKVPGRLPDASRNSHLCNLRKLGTVLAGVLARKNGYATSQAAGAFSLTAVPASPVWVNAHVPPYRRAVYGCCKEAFYNLIHSYRVAQRARGHLASKRRHPLPPDCEWSRRLAALPAHERNGLIRLARFAHLRGISTAGSDEEVRAMFREHLATDHLRVDLDGFLHKTTLAWNAAVAAGVMGPDARPWTVERQRKRPPYQLAPEAFHPDFPKQFAALGRLMEGRDRTKPPTRREARSLKPRTVESYQYAVLHGATALVALGRDPRQIQVATLVELTNFADSLEHHYQRARLAFAARTGRNEADLPEEVGTESQVIHIATGLIWVARHYCRLQPPELEALIEEASRYRPKSHGEPHLKVRERLDQIYQPGPFADFLHLGPSLERDAYEIRKDRTSSSADLDAARLGRTSLACEIEMQWPVRLSQLTRLRLHTNIVFDAIDTKRVIALHIPVEENKSRRILRWPAVPALARKIEAFLRDFHPVLAPGGSPWLFPGADAAEPLSVNAMSERIVGAIDAYVEVTMHVHLFRAFAVCNYLEANPAAFNDVRMLLGHKTFETTMQYYAYVRPKIIAIRQHAVLDDLRRAHPPTGRRR